MQHTLAFPIKTQMGLGRKNDRKFGYDVDIDRIPIRLADIKKLDDIEFCQR